jgi:hypothetical protein
MSLLVRECHHRWHPVGSEEKFARSGIAWADRMRNPPQLKVFSAQSRKFLGFDPIAQRTMGSEFAAKWKPNI